MNYSTMPSPSSMSSTLAPLDSNLPFERNFDVALLQAQDLRKHGQFDDASRVLAQLVLASPDDARVIGEYGKVMLESGRIDDAVAFLERATALQPSDWTLLSALGVAYDQTGKRDAARASFHRALTLKPGEATILSNLAVSHMQTGELDEAERLLLEASEQRKDVPGIAAKLAMVRNIRTTTAQSRPVTASTLPQPVASPMESAAESQPPAVLPAAPPVNPAPIDEPAAQEPVEDEFPATPDDADPQEIAETTPAAVVSQVSNINELHDNAEVQYEVVVSPAKPAPKTASITATKHHSIARNINKIQDISKVISEVAAAVKAPARAEKTVAATKAEAGKSSPASTAPRLLVSMQPEPRPAPAVVASASAPAPAAKAPIVAEPAAMAKPTPQTAIMTRRADVATAVSRTAAVPLVLASARAPWESMVRVSLPPAAEAVTPAVRDSTPTPSAEPRGWSDMVKGWVTAALGFISAFWA